MSDSYNSNDGQDFDSMFENNYISRSEAQRLARDEVQKTLRDIGTFNAQAQAGQQAAIREVAVAHPDFEQRRGRMLAVLQEIPLLRDAVASAESNPQLSSALPQIYEAVYKASFAPADNTVASTSEPNLDESQSGSSHPQKATSKSDLSDEGTQYQAALASQRVDLSPQNRKALIAELEKRGVGDIEF